MWTVDTAAVQLLDWNGATPGLARLKSIKHDPRIAYLGNRASGGIFNGMGEPPPPRGAWEPDPSAAVWGDGMMIARTETARRWPRQIEPLVSKYAPNVPREMRRLTLYWQGRRIGSRSVVLDNSFIKIYFRGTSHAKPICTREHLAFTGDGKYLSWTIETTKDTTVYALRILPPVVRLGRFP